jgi:hypothetical protein
MKYYTVQERGDGFGGQFLTILFTLFYCEKTNSEFLYNQIKIMEHNYDNNPEFIDKVDSLMQIKNNFNSYESFSNKSDIHVFEPQNIIKIIQSDINYYINNDTTQKIKDFFWKNKNKNYFNNNKFNVSIHIRRPNSHDNRVEGTRTPNDYYLNIINDIRSKYVNNNLEFHIYSQGMLDSFKCFEKDDIILHINEDLFSTYTGLVAGDILVTSASAFSYSAALISDGIIYYLPCWHWHPPLNGWIVCENTIV